MKRYTQGPSAIVEFKVDSANNPGGYDFDVEFLDKGKVCLTMVTLILMLGRSFFKLFDTRLTLSP